MNTVKDVYKSVNKIMVYLQNRYLEGVFPHEQKIQDTLELFSDNHSRDIYAREICWCILHNFLNNKLASSLSGLMTQEEHKAAMDRAAKIHPEMIAPTGAEWVLNLCKAATFALGQYEYRDLVGVERGDVCLDLGACFGDTSIWMCENGAAESWAFEIDKDNLEALKINVSAAGCAERVHIAPDAVSSSSGEIWYQPCAGNRGAGRVLLQDPKTDGSYRVNCVTLDGFCRANSIKPDFIKMDIEGAEPMAIAGGKEVFSNFRPKFAICIYHAWPHRWQIPLQLRDLCPDYEFYCKKSSPDCETVLLGRPKPLKGNFTGWHSTGESKSAPGMSSSETQSLESQILDSRKDVAKYLNTCTKDPAVQKDMLFIWIWVAGLHEMPELAEREEEIRRHLESLACAPVDAQSLPEYTKLYRAIHLFRSDLQKFNPQTVEGQRQMVDWFKNTGAKEMVMEWLLG